MGVNRMRSSHHEAKSMLARMMECSELRISEVARSEDGHRREVAGRVLDSTHAFRQWEVTHQLLMRDIVEKSKPERQGHAVRRMAISLIHRKAPFEYLRDRQVTGSARHRFFRVLYGPHDFANAVVREHRTYVTSVCSYLCVDRFCASSTMADIVEYEKLYTSYWQTRTSFLLDSVPSTALEQRSVLLQCIREDLDEVRGRVLGMPSRADELTLEQLRRPTGDTVRLRILSPASAPRAC
jgi:hypothetical protein